MSRHCSSAVSWRGKFLVHPRELTSWRQLIHFEAVSRGCHLNYVLIFNRPHGIAFSVKAGGAFVSLGFRERINLSDKALI